MRCTFDYLYKVIKKPAEKPIQMILMAVLNRETFQSLVPHLSVLKRGSALEGTWVNLAVMVSLQLLL